MSESTSKPPIKMGNIVTVFGSSRPKPDSPEYKEAELLGARLSAAGLSVCTGGYHGIMEAVSKGASGSNVNIIGVTSAVFSPSPNEYVNMQVHSLTLYDRLQKLIEFGNAYIVLKGGTGTLVEFSMVWESLSKGIISERPLIAVSDCWRPVVDALSAELVSEGLESSMKQVRLAPDAAEAAEIVIAALAKRN